MGPATADRRQPQPLPGDCSGPPSWGLPHPTPLGRRPNPDPFLSVSLRNTKHPETLTLSHSQATVKKLVIALMADGEKGAFVVRDKQTPVEQGGGGTPPGKGGGAACRVYVN